MKSEFHVFDPILVRYISFPQAIWDGNISDPSPLPTFLQPATSSGNLSNCAIHTTPESNSKFSLKIYSEKSYFGGKFLFTGINLGKWYKRTGSERSRCSGKIRTIQLLWQKKLLFPRFLTRAAGSFAFIFSICIPKALIRPCSNSEVLFDYKSILLK